MAVPPPGRSPPHRALGLRPARVVGDGEPAVEREDGPGPLGARRRSRTPRRRGSRRWPPMVAARASTILVRGAPIDPEQSMMMISAQRPRWSARARWPDVRRRHRDDRVDVAPPSGRYSFWKISTVNPWSLIAGFSSGRSGCSESAAGTGRMAGTARAPRSCCQAARVAANSTSERAAASGLRSAAGSARSASPAASGR